MNITRNRARCVTFICGPVKDLLAQDTQLRSGNGAEHLRKKWPQKQIDLKPTKNRCVVFDAIKKKQKRAFATLV